MRLSVIECTIDEVKKRQYEPQQTLVLLSEDIENIPEEKIDFIKDKNKEVKERRDKVDTKARTLLTLTSLLLGLISSTTSFASAKAIGVLSILPLALLFITIFLLTVYIGIDQSQTPDYSYIFSDSQSAKRTLCNDLLASQDYNERVTNFMVDLYRSALRYFSVAMLCIMVLGVGNIVSADHNWRVNQNKIQSFFKPENFDNRKLLNNEGKTNNFTISNDRQELSVDVVPKVPDVSPYSVPQMQPNL